MTLRVLHLSTFDDSGAARGAYWLHKALRRQSVDSFFLVGKKSNSDPLVRPLGGLWAQGLARLRMRMDQLPLRRYRKTDEAFWTLNWLPSGVHRQINALKPDIVHLHWIGGGLMGINELKKINCPIVWTLRDMWAFTGGCHYTNGCDQYRGMCGECPQLLSVKQNDLSRKIWLEKEKHWHDLDLWIVPISAWLGDCARGSALMRPFPIEVIPNGINTQRFRPMAKAEARAALDLPGDARVLVFGALEATRDPRKGFPQLLSALRTLAKSGRAGETILLVFGSTEPPDIPDLGIATRYVGHVHEDARLRQIYAAADVAVIPSLQEAFGKTVIEAMACGTPVVAFDSGGPRDIIDHRVDGYLARAFDPVDLAAGILWCLDTISAGSEIGQLARAKAVARYDISVVADRYFMLYQRVLEGARTSMAASPRMRVLQPAS